MKKFLLLLLTGINLIGGCNFINSKEEPLNKNELTYYVSVYEKDTAWLSIDTTSKRIRVRGIFKMKYADGKVYNGTIEGVFKGDTLKGNFDFKLNDIDKWYRNPVAFLQQKEKLIMGVGDFHLVWGIPFFDEKKPIDYDKGKFVFEPIKCQ